MYLNQKQTVKQGWFRLGSRDASEFSWAEFMPNCYSVNRRLQRSKTPRGPMTELINGVLYSMMSSARAALHLRCRRHRRPLTLTNNNFGTDIIAKKKTCLNRLHAYIQIQAQIHQCSDVALLPSMRVTKHAFIKAPYFYTKRYLHEDSEEPKV